MIPHFSDEFPAQMASNAEKFPFDDVIMIYKMLTILLRLHFVNSNLCQWGVNFARRVDITFHGALTLGVARSTEGKR